MAPRRALHRLSAAPGGPSAFGSPLRRRTVRTEPAGRQVAEGSCFEVGEDLFDHREADRALRETPVETVSAQGPDVSEESSGASGGIRAHRDRDPVPALVRNLGNGTTALRAC